MNTLFEEAPRPQSDEATPLTFVERRKSERRTSWRPPAIEAELRAARKRIDALQGQLDELNAAHPEELDRIREDASAEGREEAQQHYNEALEVERTALAHACASLARERTRFFADMQREVVKLSLAIAERVLQRTVKADATALAHVVHAATEQLADPGSATLHVSPLELERWRRAMRSTALRVEPDDSLDVEELRLESMGGAAELGWQTQLEEIEREFDQLLERKQA